MFCKVYLMKAKKRPKHVDDNCMYSVLKVVFALTINRDITKQTQRDDETKKITIFRLELA